jgi:hypothetical protein
MNFRKLLDWRMVLTYSHRWLGILGNLLFISWFLSGIVMMYRELPSFSTTERLTHLASIDLSTARVEPLDAARNAKITPATLRVAMYYDGRPVYRLGGDSTIYAETGEAIGGDSIIYADTGEVIGGRTAHAALDLVRRLAPEHAATVRYDARLENSDQWTLQELARSQLPLHRISVGDREDTYYYVSERTGEPVQKTDSESRFWGFLGAVLHYVYFVPLKRHNGAWLQFILWSSIAGLLMCLTGLVTGIWRYSISGRFRWKAKAWHSPYSSWMWWHHYAGLLFGFLSCTWILSGGLSIDPYRLYSSTTPTVKQREAATGGPIDLRQLDLQSLRKGIAAIEASFRPKEADVLQFRGHLYLTADFAPPNAARPGGGPIEHRIVSLRHPERGTFTRFDDSAMLEVAEEAMPGIAIEEATWLHEYDNYYRSRDRALVLPVLRVRYADPQDTWLYIDPHHGTIAAKEDRITRLRRWLYTGLHNLDFPYLYSRRPLWDIVMIFLLIGGLVLSATTLLPAFRRLRRHAVRVSR